MRRHEERDNVVLLAIALEFGRVVALVAVEDQQPIFAFRTRCRMEVEVLDPIQANGISSPAIVGGCDTPVGWEVALGVPVGEVVVIERIRQRMKWGQDLPLQEKAFIQDHPELVSHL